MPGADGGPTTARTAAPTGPLGELRSPDDVATTVGPLINDAAVARIEAVVDDAVARGATVLCGRERSGRVMRPTILVDVDEGARICRDEIFGPVMTLSAYDSIDDAVARVNRSSFGLQVGLFTDSVQTLLKCTEMLDVGAVIHGDAPTFRVDHMPYGGVKDSGFGREGVPFALGDYTEPKTLVLRQR